MASEVSPNWLLSVPSCTSLVAGRQGCPCFFLSFFAAMAFAPSDTCGHKKPGLWLLAKRPGLLARPFSDLFNVAASRPAKSPRGGINVAGGPPRQASSARASSCESGGEGQAIDDGRPRSEGRRGGKEWRSEGRK